MQNIKNYYTLVRNIKAVTKHQTQELHKSEN